MTELEFLNDPFRGPIAEISSLLLKKVQVHLAWEPINYQWGPAHHVKVDLACNKRDFGLNAITMTNLDGDGKNKDKDKDKDKDKRDFGSVQ